MFVCVYFAKRCAFDFYRFLHMHRVRVCVAAAVV